MKRTVAPSWNNNFFQRGRIFELPPAPSTYLRSKSCEATVAHWVAGLDVGQISDESNAKRNRDGWPWTNVPDNGSSTHTKQPRRMAVATGSLRHPAGEGRKQVAAGWKRTTSLSAACWYLIAQCRAAPSNQTDTVRKGDLTWNSTEYPRPNTGSCKGESFVCRFWEESLVFAYLEMKD